MLRLGLACVVLTSSAGLLWAPSAQAQEVVQSLSEQRQQAVILQQWDLSCGAAALATLLVYQHGDKISERDVALGMMSRSEYLERPELVSYRQGFSLLDLKRFVDVRGYRGVGLGGLSLEQAVVRAPMIVPIDTVGYSHFVVFVGMLADSVLVADPAYGNRTMSRADFERVWVELPDLGRVGFVVERRDGLYPPNRLIPHPDRFLVLR
jgi:predicted double-glycine peptidase